MTNAKVLDQLPALRLLPDHLDPQEALRENQFIPFFQPLVTMRTGQLAGFEVLARWRHPLKGLISPDTFIPVAEQDGWIGELTRQILQKAFVAATALPGPLTLAVNISSVQLRGGGLLEEITSLCIEGKFPLSRLVIEITESAVIDSPADASRMMAELKKLGCRLALDDFGTGYSSLFHLKALPFDKLKVDRSFVGSMAEKRDSRKIVAAVVGLGQSLGLTTVAEGIETQEQAEMVLWLGCDLGQGYFYGRPIPAKDLPACVSEHRTKLRIKPGSAWQKISASNLYLSPTQRLAQLQVVYDGVPVGLAFLDQNLRYISLNHKLAEMDGASVEDHLGSTVAEMIPEIFPYVAPYIKRALSGEALMDVETTIAETGKALLFSYQPARDEAGEAVGVSVAINDITERKRTESALKRSEDRYQSHAQARLQSVRKKQAREAVTSEGLPACLEVNNHSLDSSSVLDRSAPVRKGGLLAGDASMKTLGLGDFGLWLGGGADDGMARSILESLSNGVTISDASLPGAPLIYVNPAFESMTGYSGEDVVGLNCNFLQGFDHDQPGVHLIRAAIRDAREERVLLRNYRKDGTLFWNQLYLSPVFNAVGKLTHFVGIQNDVTAETEAKLKLSEERDRLHAASECSMDCLYICEAVRNESGDIVDFKFSFLNSNGAAAVSLPISTLLGARMCETLPLNRDLGLFDLYKRVVLTGEPLVHEFPIGDKEAHKPWMRVQAVKLRDGVVITASDITLRKREEERTVFKAEHDPLTTLPNRNLLRSRVEQGTVWAKRYDGMLAVFLLDLDGFKAINDTFGHAAGDEVLITGANRIARCLREVDTVLRIGGDEFVIVMPELRRQSDAEVLAARILDVLRMPMRIAAQDLSVTCSIGIALYPQTARTTEELLSRADTAMYLAKHGGKNKYELYHPECAGGQAGHEGEFECVGESNDHSD